MDNVPGSSNDPAHASMESLRQAMEAPLARNPTLTSCLGCGEPLQIGKGVILRDCFHVSCDVCLIRTIKNTLQYDVQVHCPQTHGDQRCSTLLQEREIRNLLSGEDFARYERKCLELAEGGNASSVHCFTDNCKGWIVVEGFVDSFVCSVSSQKNSLSCKAVHPGKCCKQYKLENCIYDRDDLCADEFSKFLEDSLNLHDNTGYEGQSNNNLKPRINLEELMTLSDALLVRNTEVNKYLLCDNDIQVNEGVVMKDCFHFLCDECLIGTVTGALEENIEVRCPIFLDDGQRCGYVIQEREIRSVVKPEDYAKYEQRCLEVAEGSFTTSVHCVTPNCKGWVVLDPNRNVTSFTCEVCTSENCVSCKAIHQGKSCAEHLAEVQQNEDEKLGEEAIKEMLDNRQAMLCPGCKMLIMKDGGCDFIRCFKCKFEICWPTRGPRWGPGGAGDDSGGCGCTLAKRCHPDCEGCHVFIK